MSERRICLVSTLHLSYNPRLLKEADALHEAGYSVRVVTVSEDRSKANWDNQLMSTRKWRLERVNLCADNLSGRTRWLTGALRQRVYRLSGSLRRRRDGLEKAFNRHFTEMCRATSSESADLFVAHNLQALPVAAFAAQKWKARLGFDAEDFHRGEISASDPDRAELRRLIIDTEEKYIPRCDYLTAASDGIGAAYAATLNIRRPDTILNVFSLSDRSGVTPQRELAGERHGKGLSLYWYSQVIGRDRGLEDAIEAVGLIRSGVHLHIRGTWAQGYEQKVQAKIKALGVKQFIHILSPVPPAELVERAKQHDVGLALERGETENRKIAVTNKLFVYMLAGLAIVATDVPSQATILHKAAGSGFTYSFGQVEALVSGLKRWIECPDDLAKVKRQSLFWAISQFNWELEAVKLVQLIRQVLREHPDSHVSPPSCRGPR